MQRADFRDVAEAGAFAAEFLGDEDRQEPRIFQGAQRLVRKARLAIDRVGVLGGDGRDFRRAVGEGDHDASRAGSISLTQAAIAARLAKERRFSIRSGNSMSKCSSMPSMSCTVAKEVRPAA